MELFNDFFTMVHIFLQSFTFLKSLLILWKIFIKEKNILTKYNESIANLKKSCDVINIKQIISKCILLKDDNIFFISLCVDVNDHD